MYKYILVNKNNIMYDGYHLYLRKRDYIYLKY